LNFRGAFLAQIPCKNTINNSNNKILNKKNFLILGIESSCDETSAAVVRNNKLLSNYIAGQKIHEEYGGVIPELASRAHQQNILPVIDIALKNADIKLHEIDAIAYTRGPGLMGALLVGSSFAKGLAIGSGKPLIPVNHVQSHIMAHFIDDGENYNPPQFPFLCLTISGGHTQIVLVKSFVEMEIIGATIDDAAGEAFDKTAKIMGLPYPGGPIIDGLAKNGNPLKFEFNEPNIPDFNYSFSGLKTSILYFLQAEMKKNSQFIEENKTDIAASVQHTIVNILLKKLKKAAKAYQVENIAIAGGVSANSYIKQKLKETSEELGWKIHIPKPVYCTDNAAMIAISGYYNLLNGKVSENSLHEAPLARFLLGL
jgi:N6-L-threonylcarbamoyladenine synthase